MRLRFSWNKKNNQDVVLIICCQVICVCVCFFYESGCSVTSSCRSRIRPGLVLDILSCRSRGTCACLLLLFRISHTVWYGAWWRWWRERFVSPCDWPFLLAAGRFRKTIYVENMQGGMKVHIETGSLENVLSDRTLISCWDRRRRRLRRSQCRYWCSK